MGKLMGKLMEVWWENFPRQIFQWLEEFDKYIATTKNFSLENKQWNFNIFHEQLEAYEQMFTKLIT